MTQGRFQWLLIGLLILVGLLAVAKKELFPQEPEVVSFAEQQPAQAPTEPPVQQTEIPPTKQEQITPPIAPPEPSRLELSKVDPQLMGKFFEKGGDRSLLPKDMSESFKEFEKRRAATFASKEAAQAQMKDLETCVSQALPDYRSAVASAPEEMKAQVGKIGDMVHAECVKWGRQLVDRYPSLRGEFENLILKKASTNVLKISGESAP